ncbi:class I SAM-dependent methyltransferase [Burkholderia sp. MSMB1589WGS]|uniref:class I SAM-dependent methyltransferase n=1 Tax=Burkholderia sp. MSMB1589WGS TaxID=1636425 RepID=UPI0007BA0D23|nr:class I SAM-dependent methyltransferase [Burkholderia sp. MSMB1589WGS]
MIDGFYRMSNQTESRQLYPVQEYIDQQNMPPKEGLRGICPVCGSEASFTKFTENLRESGTCSHCGSSSRQRQMALMLRRRFHVGPIGPIEFPRGFCVYNAESNGPLHKRLSKLPGYVCSEYFGDRYRSGEIVKGVRHEDLQKLSFRDASVDVVLSSDVLEHMPAPYDAHRDIFRVLKPGGRHIFTVPFNPSRYEDDVRARLVDGEIEYLAEKQFHGDPVRPGEGILVWTIFGVDMLHKLEQIGYVARAWNLYEPEHGIVGNCNTIFEAYKPDAGKGFQALHGIRDLYRSLTLKR